MQIQKQRTISRAKLTSMVTSVLLFINFFSFSSQKLAEIYDKNALLFNAVMILIILCLELGIIRRIDGLIVLYFGGFLALEIIIGETSIGSALNILFMISTIMAFKYVKIGNGFWRTVLIPITISLIYVIFHAKNYWTLFDLTDQGLITEDKIYINPNTLSVFLTIAYIILSLYSERKRVQRKWLWPIRIGILFLNYLLKCRTGMMIFSLVMLLELIIPYKLWLSRRFALSAYSVVLFCGIGFPRLFCSLSTNQTLNYFIHDLTGKFLFTGRERIWLNFYEYVDSNPIAYLFGVGTDNVAVIIGNSSIHNSYLWIMSNCGIIGVLLVDLFILWMINRAYRNGINRMKIICVWGYLVVLLNFYTEATICYGFTAVIMNMLLGLTNNNSLKVIGDKNECNKSNNYYCLLQR